MKKKSLFALLGLTLALGMGAGAGMSLGGQVNEAKAAGTLNYKYFDIEIRCTRPSGWDLSNGDNVYIHTWHDGESNVAYKMNWLWQNEFDQAVFSWTPSEAEPLFENMAFEVGGWKSKSSDLSSPTSAGIYNYYDDSGWKSATVEKMTLYFYDYDNKFDGEAIYAHAARDGVSGLVFDDGTGTSVTPVTNLSGNGIVYSFQVSNAVNRVTFQNEAKTITTGETSGLGGSYCYVYAPTSKISGNASWWNNINYVYAHNWAMNLMNFRGVSAAAGADADGTDCEGLYETAKNTYKAFDNYIKKEINDSFPDALARMSAWAEHHHESFVVEDGKGSFQSNFVMASPSSASTNMPAIVIGVSSAIVALGVVGLFIRRKKENQ